MMYLDRVSELIDAIIAYAEKRGLSVSVQELAVSGYSNGYATYEVCTDSSCGSIDEIISAIATDDYVLGKKTILIVDPVKRRVIFIGGGAGRG